MIWAILIAISLNVVHAYIDAYRIRKKLRSTGKDINHLPGAVIYTLLVVLTAWIFGNLWYAIPMLLIRPVVFDPMLNELRNKWFFYVSPTTTSLIDQMEIKYLGTNGVVHWLFWLGLAAISAGIIFIFM